MASTATILHPLKLRFLAEDLIRRRRAADVRRSAASQRQGHIDPNPHQIDAVVFALQRIAEGGCILGDEVGLGKTIEAGLVIAQLLAEGRRRILVIVPKPLIGQWQNELYDHFGLHSHEAAIDAAALSGDGIFLMGREIAGSERGHAALTAAPRFDLCVIDEAHEIFAGIHRRFDRQGGYRDDAEVAVIAHRVRDALVDCPKLLLTATPIQNSLAELWGLVTYIEPTGTLLGDLGTFRALFTEGDDATLFVDQAAELRRRLARVVRRTLRRQAEEFLERPFVRRRARLFEYTMSAAERALYEDVTAYLLEPYLCAFRGQERRLLLLGFHRRMASSLPALASSLRRVEERLAAMARRDPLADRGGLMELRADLEFDADIDLAPADSAADDGDALAVASGGSAAAAGPDSRVGKELARVRALRERAEGVTGDSKAAAMVVAVRLVLERGARGEGSGKVVIFTESLTTQDYLTELLVSELPIAHDDITCFRGQNDSERALAALARWEDEVGCQLEPRRRPAPQTAVRLALVHEFRTRSRVFLSTEAGGKGLNLQFCDTLINYDLPWNPQRIEQRIGRIHRYGQSRDVMVINFLARDNEAERLLFDILGRKLELFGTILDASDVVLHEAGDTPPETLANALGAGMEASLLRIYERARDARAVARDLSELSAHIGAQRESLEASLARTQGLIESRLDQSVRRQFRRIQDELPAALAGFDRDLEQVVMSWLAHLGVIAELRRTADRMELSVPPNAALPADWRAGGVVSLGAGPADPQVALLHLAHPLARAALEWACAPPPAPIALALTVAHDHPLAAHRGRRGRIALTRATYDGLEVVEQLVLTALLAGDEAPLDAGAARALLDLPGQLIDADALPMDIGREQLDDAIEECLFRERLQFAAVERPHFHGSLHQVDRSLEDRQLVLRQRRARAVERFVRAQEQRDGAISTDARRRAERVLGEAQDEIDRLDADIDRLGRRDDPAYQELRLAMHARRYAPPRVEPVIEAIFELRAAR